MKYLLGCILALCTYGFANAQTQDSLNLNQDTVKLYTKGNITSKTFQVEEIQVHSECKCGNKPCSCGSWQNQHPEDRFESADKILSRSGRVSLIRRGNYGFEPVLNGMTTERTNITIDGMKIFGACTGKMDPVTSYVEPNNLKQFDVEEGAGGSEYGTSIGGTVNMETQGAQIGAGDHWSGNAGLGFDAVSNGLNSMLTLNKSSKKWAVKLNGTYRKNQNYKAGGGEEVAHSQLEKWNTSLSAKYMLSERDLMRFDFIYDDADNVGYPGLAMDVDYARAQMYGLTYIHYPAGDLFKKLTFKGYANTVHHNMNNAGRTDEGMLMQMPGQTKTFGGYAKAEIDAGQHTIIAKMDGYFNNSFADMTMYPTDADQMYMVTWPDVDKTDIGIYLEDNYRWKEKNLFSLKGRVEYLSNLAKSQTGIDQAKIIGQDISLRDQRLTATISGGYQRTLTDNLTTWLSLGYTERAPNVSEQYAFFIYNAYDGYNYVGDYDLKNEKSAQAELGLNYEVENKYGARATAFYYQMYDYILSTVDPDLTPVTAGANGVKITDNIPKATMSGASINLFYNPIEKVNFTTQFSFTRGETGKGTPLPLISPMRNITAVKYNFLKNGTLAFEAESALAQDRINPEFGEVTSPGYAIFHLRGTYNFSIAESTLSVNAGIENLLDKNYRDHLDWGTIARPGRNFYVDLRYQF